jgi:predicted aspartyl protease
MPQSARLTVCVASVIWIFSAFAAQAADDKPCRLVRIASLDLTYENHRPTIPVTINGETKTFLIDTGAIYSSLTRDAAKTLGLALQPLDPGRFSMFNGDKILYAVTAASFGLGRQTLKNFSFMVLPDGWEKEKFDGLLAPDLLSRMDVELDFSNGKFNLWSQDHCPDSVVYWADDYASLNITFDKVGDGIVEQKHILVNAKLDGTDVRMAFDTGAPYSTMTVEQARHVFHWGDTVPEMKRLNADHPEKPAIYAYPFKTLTFNGVTITNPKILLMETPPIHYYTPNYDMLLGIETLSRLHIYISYGEKVMYITGANAKRETSPAKP